jgi:Na+/H+ antiporter NhaA
MSESDGRWRRRTAWAQERSAPLRRFVRTESGSAVVLVAAIVAALVWANVDAGSYRTVWDTRLALHLGRYGVGDDLRTWLNSGLMTFFFLVVGLETRREFDLGDLRERRRFVLPMVAGVVGMAIPVAVYLLINLGAGSEPGWGVAMSTDTALALGVLAVLGRDIPDRMRVFVLTVFVVDDLAALVVIAVAYSHRVRVMPIVLAAVTLAAAIVVIRLRLRPIVFAVLGLLMWAFLRAGGIDPIVVGLTFGLIAPAYTPLRSRLQEATGLVREFREQPTPELARTARTGLVSTLSPNARWQSIYHPWTSFGIVPLFALANAGIGLDGSFLAHAYTAPVTLGVLIGYVVGKPVAVIASSWAVTRWSRGRIRPPVGRVAVAGSGTIAGIGFTVALLIASRAFHGVRLDEAKLGALSAAVLAALLTAAVLWSTSRLPAERRNRVLFGDPRLIQDLIPAVDPDRDHVRGPRQAEITIIEFGDFQCPYCGQAEPMLREVLGDATIRYVWRHLPLDDVHPNARFAAEAAEAAADQGAFWPMRDLLLEHQDELSRTDLIGFATRLGLDVDRFTAQLDDGVHQARIDRDVESAELSGVSGTPTFFVNGQRLYDRYDVDTITATINAERQRLDAGSGRAT